MPETIKGNHINVNNGDVNGTMQYFLWRPDGVPVHIQAKFDYVIDCHIRFRISVLIPNISNQKIPMLIHVYFGCFPEFF